MSKYETAKEACAARYGKRNKLMVRSGEVYSAMEHLAQKRGLVLNEQFCGGDSASHSISVSWSWQCYDGVDYAVFAYWDTGGFADLFVFHNNKVEYETIEAELIAEGYMASKEERKEARQAKADDRAEQIAKKGLRVGMTVTRASAGLGGDFVLVEITKAGKLVLEYDTEHSPTGKSRLTSAVRGVKPKVA